MDEKDFATKSQGSEPVEVSIWAKRAIWFVGFGYLATMVWFVLVLFRTPPNRYAPSVFIVLIGGSVVSIIAGLIISVIAIVKIVHSKGRIKGTGQAVSAIALGMVYILIATVPAIIKIQRLELRYICGEHLSALGKSLHAYAEDYGIYPTPNQWCDILVKNNYITKGKLEWPRNYKAKCSYAINPNCEPNSTEDVILLFETNGGWNIFGGAELLTIYNHQKGEGAFVLHNDGHVIFEHPDPNGHFNYELNWGEKVKGRDLK
jgi:hypothetical protein